MGTRAALVVGLSKYEHKAPLCGGADARAVHRLLKHDEDGSQNFECDPHTDDDDLADTGGVPVSGRDLTRWIERLFHGDHEVALFFFAGHAELIDGRAHLVTSRFDPKDAQMDEAVSMDQLTAIINASPSRNVVVLLDCCHSGALANSLAADSVKSRQASTSVLREGVAIITATGPEDAAVEFGGLHNSVFTTLLIDALDGGAADIDGEISVANVYAFLDGSLGAFDQRPVLKANVARLVSLRRARPSVSIELLRSLPVHFPTPTAAFQLDPSFEKTERGRVDANVDLFEQFKTLRDAKLLEPVEYKDLYFAAMERGECRLTPLGRNWWLRAKRDLV